MGCVIESSCWQTLAKQLLKPNHLLPFTKIVLDECIKKLSLIVVTFIFVYFVFVSLKLCLTFRVQFVFHFFHLGFFDSVPQRFFLRS